jgi:hypothetical protein
MKKQMKLFFAILAILFLCSSLWAVDAGLVLDSSGGAAGSGGDSVKDFSGVLIPRLTGLLGNSGEFFISAGIRADYLNEEWLFPPELLRTDIFFTFGKGDFRMGRMSYTDPLGYVADGLFDGAEFSYNSSLGTFSLGAWYTGFLYKKRVNITMTEPERESINTKFDYADFQDTYFATRRAFAALGWENPSLGEHLRMNLALLAQFDLSDTDLQTQYGILSLAVPVGSFVFDLGGCFEMTQNSGESGKAFAANFGITWMFPVLFSFSSQLSLLGLYSSGASDSMDVFLPITNQSQGNVLKPRLSGISLLGLDYIVRLHKTFSLALSDNFFMRNDLKTLAEGFGEEGKLLGNEFFARLFWSPLSDFHVNLGAGMFMPSMGDAAPDANSVWRVEFGLVWSLY